MNSISTLIKNSQKANDDIRTFNEEHSDLDDDEFYKQLEVLENQLTATYTAQLDFHRSETEQHFRDQLARERQTFAAKEASHVEALRASSSECQTKITAATATHEKALEKSERDCAAALAAANASHQEALASSKRECQTALDAANASHQEALALSKVQYDEKIERLNAEEASAKAEATLIQGEVQNLKSSIAELQRTNAELSKKRIHRTVKKTDPNTVNINRQPFLADIRGRDTQTPFGAASSQKVQERDPVGSVVGSSPFSAASSEVGSVVGSSPFGAAGPQLLNEKNEESSSDKPRRRQVNEKTLGGPGYGGGKSKKKYNSNRNKTKKRRK